VAKAFAEKVGTDLPLVADVKHQAARSYGIFDEENHRAKRFTFTIDQQGVIRAIHMDREAIDVDEAFDACRVLQRVDSTAAR
jgi:alkyl hydroperoxide reductase subunit AhpC